ncbi:MAG: DNA replication/repair protein RecF [Candidatus Rokubacteria bacterium]|nr:DNA replication/repair protein RecF [Candidatus Rokubacteria bacterium]
MHIEWIHLSDFRNYRTLSYSPAAALNVVTGPNAQGKTNLLEALALLLVGRSFRAGKPGDLPRWGSEGATLAGQVCRGDVTRELRRSVGRRQDGGWAVLGEGCAWVRAIPFSWQDVGVVGGGPQARRNFLDGFAGKIFPAHLPGLTRYRKILARRNHLLQSGLAAGEIDARIEPWDQQLASEGVDLMDRRRRAGAELAVEVARLYPALAGSGAVRLEYQGSLDAGISAAGFVEALRARRRDEVRRGQSLVGPHRDDLGIEMDGRDVRSFGSRGQQRVMALALRLAEAAPVERAVGSRPVLLLDDALSELDPAVQGNVLRHVEEAGQVFLTTVERSLPARQSVRWAVRGGHVEDQSLQLEQGAA